MEFQIPEISSKFYMAALPIFILAISSIITLMQSVFKSIGNPIAIKSIHYLGLATALLACPLAVNLGGEVSFLGGSYLFDGLAMFGQVMILIIALITSMLFSATIGSKDFYRGEIISLFHMILMGMLVMVSSNELISVFIGLELASIGLYTLIGYIRPSRASKEGAVKYLVLGSFASGFLLFGFSFLYAGTGTLILPEMFARLGSVAAHPWVEIGALLAMVGLAFKLALAPFHLWAPDAYEASPTGLTAFMATAVKIMVIVVVARLLVGGVEHLSTTWGALFMFGAILSTIFGNILALVQSSLKRMLAYSSVSHAGYMAIALCAVSTTSKSLPIAAILFYLVVYSLISLATFGILMYLETERNDNIQLDDVAGLAKKRPVIALALAALMFSFAGIPPTAGFMSKLFVFNAALLEGLFALVVIGLIGAVISVYYYLRVIVRMYMDESPGSEVAMTENKSYVVCGIVGLSLVLILLLGTVLPQQLMDLAKTTTESLLAH